MSEMFLSLGIGLVQIYTTLFSGLPVLAQRFINLFLIVLVIVFYSILIWNFYRWISKKEILKLNLKIYEQTESSFLKKSIAGFFYIIEKLIILPFVILLWYSLFTLFLIFLTENAQINSILLISAIIITSIRMAAYYKEDLSRDLAKLLPFTLLAVFLTQFSAFEFKTVLMNLSLISQFLSEVWIYFIFIFAIEIILTIFDVVFRVSGVEEEGEELKVD